LFSGWVVSDFGGFGWWRSRDSVGVRDWGTVAADGPNKMGCF